MAESENKATLYKKMARVMGELTTFGKDATNTFHKYDYVSAATVFEVVGRAMAKHGIAFFSSVVSVNTTEDSRYIVEYEYTFACSETGATQTSRWFGEGSHTSKNGTIDDKTLNKIATTSQKYFLMSTFVVSSADEKEIDQQKNQSVHWSKTDLGKEQIQGIKDKALGEYSWTEEQLSASAKKVGSIQQFESLSDYGHALKTAYSQLYSDEPAEPDTTWQQAMFLAIKGDSETDPFGGYPTFSAFLINNKIEEGMNPQTVLKLWQDKTKGKTA